MTHLSSSCENPWFYLWSQNPLGLKLSSPTMSTPTITEPEEQNTPKSPLDSNFIFLAWFHQLCVFPMELPAIPAAPQQFRKPCPRPTELLQPLTSSWWTLITNISWGNKDNSSLTPNIFSGIWLSAFASRVLLCFALSNKQEIAWLFSFHLLSSNLSSFISVSVTEGAGMSHFQFKWRAWTNRLSSWGLP